MKNAYAYFKVFFLLILILVSASMQQLQAQDVGLKWVKQLASSGDDRAYGVAYDSWGNVYATGQFSDTIDLGNPVSPIISNGSLDAFLVKFNAAGVVQWARSWGTTGFDRGYGVAVDPRGNVYVTGQFGGTVNFDPNGSGTTVTTNGAYDVFVAKLDAAGNLLWAKNLGGKSFDIGFGIAVDSLGNAYTTGYFSDTADFDPGIAAADTFKLASQGGYDIFVSKLDSAGRFLWAKRMGSTSSDQGNAITLDHFGNVYTTGQFGSTVDFNPGAGIANLTSAGSNDIFVCKLDANGNYIWAKNMGGSKADIGNSIAANENGVYTTGYFAGDADFDPGPNMEKLTSDGGFFKDIFISRLDTAGNYVWAKGIGGNFQDEGRAIALDASGNVYTIGNFFNTVDFNPGSGTVNLTDPGGTGIFILKLDAGGNYIWAKGMGGSGADEGNSIKVDASGNVYSTGEFFEDSVDFDPGPNTQFLVGKKSYDVFVQKLGCLDTFSSSIEVQANCNGYLFNGHLYTASGTYTEIFHSTGGCDSVVTLQLTVGIIDSAVINVNGFTLSTTRQYASYQWLLNGNPIPGATDSAYTVQQNGDYQVVVADTSGCTDTSGIYTVNNYTGIENINGIAGQIHIYPNPAADKVYIQSLAKLNITLTTIDGKILQQIKNAHSISLKNLAAGLYLLRLTNEEGMLISVEKIVKQKAFQ